MFFTQYSFTPQPGSEVETPKTIQYRLSDEGTKLWHSTKDTDQYYSKWFMRLAVAELSAKWIPGCAFSIVDHAGNELARGKTVPLDKGGP